MRHIVAVSLALIAFSLPAFADDLPQGAKAPPPEPLPEASCDATKANSGDWLVGRWVAPYSKWEFQRAAAGDLEGLASPVHRLASASSSLHLTALAARCRAIENAARARDGKAQNLAKDLGELWDRSLKALNEVVV